MIPILKSDFLNFALVSKYTVHGNNFIVHSIKLIIGVLMCAVLQDNMSLPILSGPKFQPI